MNKSKRVKIMNKFERMRMTDSRAYWNALHDMTGKQRAKGMPDRMVDEEGDVCEGEAAGEACAAAWESLGTERQNDVRFNEDFLKTLRSEECARIETEKIGDETAHSEKVKLMNREIELEEVSEAVKKLKSNKSPGIDNIINELFT